MFPSTPFFPTKKTPNKQNTNQQIDKHLNQWKFWQLPANVWSTSRFCTDLVLSSEISVRLRRGDKFIYSDNSKSLNWHWLNPLRLIYNEASWAKGQMWCPFCPLHLEWEDFFCRSSVFGYLSTVEKPLPSPTWHWLDSIQLLQLYTAPQPQNYIYCNFYTSVTVTQGRFLNISFFSNT